MRHKSTCEKMVLLTAATSDATIDSGKQDLVISYFHLVDGKEVTSMLHVFVSEKQFEQYNQLLGRGML